MIVAGNQEAWIKSAVLIAVALLHAGILAAIGGLRVTDLDLDSDPEFRSQIFFLEPAPPNSAVRNSTMARSTPLGDLITHNDTAQVIESTAPLALPSVDWHAESGRAAAVVTARAEFAPQDGSAAELPEDLFRSPFHRRGDSQQLGNGELITWTDGRNGRCYVTNQAPAAARIDERVIVTICKPQGQRSRGDLFDELKPSYLRSPADVEIDSLRQR